MGGDTTSFVYEISYVDPKGPNGPQVTMVSQNMTWSNLLQCRETVVYQPSSDKSKTTMSQSAKIIALCGGWQKIKSKIEEASVERFRENAAKGREGFEMVLETARKLFEQEREKIKIGAPLTT